MAGSLPAQGKWPCLFTASDTTGEKDFEEFFTSDETVDLERFDNIGVIRLDVDYDDSRLALFEREIASIRAQQTWDKQQIVDLFHRMIPGFAHLETGKYLDSKM